MGGGGGGAWKVAYADFVTAMMAFFMVMWLVAQNDKTKKAVAEYFQDPYHYSLKHKGGSSQLPGRSKDASGPSSILPNGKAGSGAGTDRMKSGVKVQLAGDPNSMPNTDEVDENRVGEKPNQFIWLQRQPRGNGVKIVFEENSAKFTDASLVQLKRLIPELLGKPNKIEIRGHATHRPLPADNEFGDNWGLCFARSRAVMNYFAEHGIEPDRMRLSQSGPNEPISLGHDEAQQAQNARVEVYLLDEYVRNQRGKVADQKAEIH